MFKVHLTEIMLILLSLGVGMIYYLDLFGCVIFAITAIFVAASKELDVLGVLVAAFLTAVGGGTLRDLILNTDVFWTHDVTYLYVILICSLSTYFLVHFKDNLLKYLFYADAFGLALFTVIGTKKALKFGLREEVAIIMGILTGVAGGIIRDIIFNDKPIVLRREIYVTASILSGGSFVILNMFGIDEIFSTMISITLGLCLRSYAIYYKVHLPLFFKK